MTNLEIFNFVNVCSNMLNKNLPLRLAYALRYNLNLLMPFYKACDDERNNIIKRYAEINDNGDFIAENGQIKFKDNKAYDELNELLSIENEVKLTKVNMEIVEKTEADNYDSITMQELNVLMSIIEE